jgi:hypothetical protein
VRTPDTPIACQMGQESNSLDGLSISESVNVGRKKRRYTPEPHFICKDTI